MRERSIYLLLLLATAKLLFHLITHQGYGYFRDEFYYIACSEHLAWGYVDQPPFSIFLLRLNRWFLGDSLLALRFLPALTGAITVFLTGLIARRLGGNTYAQMLAAFAAFVAGSYLGNNAFFSMNSFDLLFWTASALTITYVLQEQKLRHWLILGLLIGLGLLNKISMLWFSAGFVAGLILTQHRRLLLTKGPWLAGLIAVLLFLPHILWQVQHDWPTLEFIRNATSQKMAENPPLRFALQQFRSMNYFTFPIWIGGLIYFFSTRGRQFRTLGWIYVFTFLLLIAGKKSRPGYLAPAYAMLFAAGAVYIEAWISERNWNWVKPVSVLLLLAGFLWRVSFSVPVLPVEIYIRYARWMGVVPSTSELKELAELPQHYADMHGWKELVGSVAKAYESLTPEEKKNCVVFGQNYGQAGAVSFFGKKYGLPRAISGHNNYWIWGTGDTPIDVVIVIGGELEDNQEVFESLELATTHHCRYCMPYENNLPIYIGRKLKIPLATLWPELKHYD